MEDISINPLFQVRGTSTSSIIKVIGVGGAGSNTVNYMYHQGIKDVTFIVCNTDKQALDDSPVPVKVQLGRTLTLGLGAGNDPRAGAASAVESIEDIKETLLGTQMLFITAGMGGGTGTGAAPVIARVAKEQGILTIGVVSIPFKFEGKPRIRHAIEGIDRLRDAVDSLIVINSERLVTLYGDLGTEQALDKAHQVLATAVRGISEMISRHRRINVDLADVRTAMTDSGTAIMGTGTASGEERGIVALQEALRSPLLNFNDITGARHILLNITCGREQQLNTKEMGEMMELVQNICHSDNESNLIWGFGTDDRADDSVEVTLVATGFTTSDMMSDKHAKTITINADGSIIEGDERTSKSEKSNTIELPISSEATDKKALALYADQPASRVKSTASLKETIIIPSEKLYDEETIRYLEDTPAYVRRAK